MNVLFYIIKYLFVKDSWCNDSIVVFISFVVYFRLLDILFCILISIMI